MKISHYGCVWNGTTIYFIHGRLGSMDFLKIAEIMLIVF